MELSFGKLTELYDENHMKIFELFESLVEDILESKVSRVKLCKTFLNLKTGAALIECMVNFGKESISVKVLHADDPIKAITKYYEAEE